MEVIGIRHSEFEVQDRHSGQPVKITGTTIYYSYDDRNVDGIACDKFFLSDQRAGQIGYIPLLGDEIRIFYNKYGKVDSVSKV